MPGVFSLLVAGTLVAGLSGLLDDPPAPAGRGETTAGERVAQIFAPSPGTHTICFFRASDFRGARFCLSSRQRLQLPPEWNNSISSISVERGGGVTVCTGRWFNGTCTLVTTSMPTLGPLDNAISSIRMAGPGAAVPDNMPIAR